ncbi:MAG: glycosyltransferase family 4 protein [Christensenellales bacterium]|jgi:glycosyltransferase involved in cell wall biosynthesis
MRIAFFTKYHEDGASSRCRSYQYAPFFEAAGHECAFFPLMYDGYVRDLYAGRNRRLKKLACVFRRVCRVLAARRKFDLLVVEKELAHGLPCFVERLLLGGSAYTLDFDDAHALRYRQGRVTRLLFKNKVDRLCERARLITVGNRWYFGHIKKGVLEYLPTVVDAARYPLEGFEKQERPVPVVVWIGSPGTVSYLKALVPVLAGVAKKHAFRLRVIGAQIEAHGLDVECVAWDAKTEFSLLANSDIGIMPLSGTAWEDGKCGYKLIQYMAAGLPTVASPAAANREITLEGETGFLASSEARWRAALSTLLANGDMRRRMGAAGRARALSHYALQAWGERYVSMLESAAGKAKPL